MDLLLKATAPAYSQEVHMPAMNATTEQRRRFDPHPIDVRNAAPRGPKPKDIHMDTIVWIAQGLLAVAMRASGATKLTKNKEQLAASGMAWTEDFRENQIKGIGTLEILAAIGLIVPALFDVAPVLVGVAAVGVVLLMLGAAATHMRRNEPQMVVINLVIGAIALFIAIMRFGPESFSPPGRSIDEPGVLAPEVPT
jgi:uncharacterized membrane protein YphA (DoxX/SURF4 family)